MQTFDSPEPRYKRGEVVHFAGGTGIIRSYQLESGQWVYQVEVGAESGELMFSPGMTLLLSEADLFS
jgi:hypothetical protein